MQRSVTGNSRRIARQSTVIRSPCLEAAIADNSYRLRPSIASEACSLRWCEFGHVAWTSSEGRNCLSFWELLLIPLGFAVGAYGTLVGAGGGFVLVPALLLIYPDQPPSSVTSISLAVVFVNASSGSAAYARLKRIDYFTGLMFAAASIPGAIGGAFLVSVVPRRTFDLLFALVLLGLAAYTLWGIGRPLLMREPLRGRGVVTRG